MATLIRSLNTTALAARQLVVFTVAWLLAESFYKFHSFTLEMLAFLATWGLLDAVSMWVDRFTARRESARPGGLL